MIRGSWKAGLLFAAGAVLLVATFLRLQADLGIWRVGEIGELLTQKQTKALSDSFALLVGKMELLRRKAERQADAESDDVLEVRLRLMTPQSFPSSQGPDASLLGGWERTAVLAVVTGLRVLQGKPPAATASPPESPDLRDAYVWERSRRYSEAVPLYQRVLAGGALDANQRSAVVLHLGFCQVLSGSRSAGRESFEQVRRVYANTEAATAAKTLLSSLDYFEAQLAVLPQGSDWAALGRLSFYLADYTAAERYLKQAPHDADNAYLLGRVAEETGRGTEAEAQYREAARVGATTPTAGVPTAALRRLYLLGSVYEDRPELAAEAKTALAKRGESTWVSQLPTLVPVAASIHVAVAVPAAAPAAAFVAPQERPPEPSPANEPETASLPNNTAEAPPPSLSEPSEDLLPVPLPTRWAPSPEPTSTAAPTLTPTTLELALPSFATPKKKEGWAALRWGFLATGVAAALTLGGSATFGALQYPAYQAATNKQQLTELHDQLALAQTVNIVSGVVALVGLGTGGALWLLAPTDESESGGR